MIDLNEDQQRAVDRGEPLLVCVAGRELVILRSEV